MEPGETSLMTPQEEQRTIEASPADVASNIPDENAEQGASRETEKEFSGKIWLLEGRRVLRKSLEQVLGMFQTNITSAIEYKGEFGKALEEIERRAQNKEPLPEIIFLGSPKYPEGEEVSAEITDERKFLDQRRIRSDSAWYFGAGERYVAEMLAIYEKYRVLSKPFLLPLSWEKELNAKIVKVAGGFGDPTLQWPKMMIEIIQGGQAGVEKLESFVKEMIFDRVMKYKIQKGEGETASHHIARIHEVIEEAEALKKEGVRMADMESAARKAYPGLYRETVALEGEEKFIGPETLAAWKERRATANELFSSNDAERYDELDWLPVVSQKVREVTEVLHRHELFQDLAVAGRTKQRERVARKLEKKKKINPAATLTDITDFAALRITGRNYTDLVELQKEIETAYGNRILQKENFFARQKEDNPDYRAVHYLIADDEERNFEIQLRTEEYNILTSLTHPTTYKEQEAVGMLTGTGRNVIRHVAESTHLVSLHTNITAATS